MLPSVARWHRSRPKASVSQKGDLASIFRGDFFKFVWVHVNCREKKSGNAVRCFPRVEKNGHSEQTHPRPQSWTKRKKEKRDLAIYERWLSSNYFVRERASPQTKHNCWTSSMSCPRFHLRNIFFVTTFLPAVG